MTQTKIISPVSGIEPEIPFAQKVTTSGSIIYIGIAPPGTLQATAGWQAKKVDQTDPNNIVIKWADSGKFTQIATDLTALTYS